MKVLTGSTIVGWEVLARTFLEVAVGTAEGMEP